MLITKTERNIMNIGKNRYQETTRPAIYRALKYWGKKPHNIWGMLINEYSKPNDIVFDPFAGSALTFFESVRFGRKPIICDVNPMTSFLVDVYSAKIDYDELNKYFKCVVERTKNTEIYKENYLCECQYCGKKTDIFNYLYENDICTKRSYKCSACKKTFSETVNYTPKFKDLGLWLPSYDISNFQSICKSTLESFGGNDIKDIWPDASLQLLSYIFNLISSVPEPYRKVLTFTFLQTVHLTTKMCASRSEVTNRPLSTSWGRPAYMYLKNRLEQNPLVQFVRAFSGPNGVINAFKSRDNYLKEYTYSNNIATINNVSGISLHGNTKSLNITPKSVDLIITDPPYGNIIQYGELCVLWNVWLTKMYPQYTIKLEDEIIVKDSESEAKYVDDMSGVFSMCKNALKDEGKLIFTFNSNKANDWFLILQSIKNSNFVVEDYFSQNNLRSSESNVSAKTGQAISDYYIILSKAGSDKTDELKQCVFSRLGALV